MRSRGVDLVWQHPPAGPPPQVSHAKPAKHTVLGDHAAGKPGRGTFWPSASGPSVVLTTTLSKEFDYCGLCIQATCLDSGMWANDKFKKVAVTQRIRWGKVIVRNERAVIRKMLRCPAALL